MNPSAPSPVANPTKRSAMPNRNNAMVIISRTSIGVMGPHPVYSTRLGGRTCRNARLHQDTEGRWWELFPSLLRLCKRGASDSFLLASLSPQYQCQEKYRHQYAHNGGHRICSRFAGFRICSTRSPANRYSSAYNIPHYQCPQSHCLPVLHYFTSLLRMFDYSLERFYRQHFAAV